MDHGIEITEEEHVAMRSRRIEEKLIGFHRFDLPAEKKRNLKKQREREREDWVARKRKMETKGGIRRS